MEFTTTIKLQVYAARKLNVFFVTMEFSVEKQYVDEY